MTGFEPETFDFTDNPSPHTPVHGMINGVENTNYSQHNTNDEITQTQAQTTYMHFHSQSQRQQVILRTPELNFVKNTV